MGDESNYLVYTPGRDGRLGTADDVLDPIAGGYFNAAANTVTLFLYRPLNLHGEARIVVRGTGPNPITDLNGVPLDGAGNGTPGHRLRRHFWRGDPGRPAAPGLHQDAHQAIGLPALPGAVVIEAIRHPAEPSLGGAPVNSQGASPRDSSRSSR